MEKDYDDSAFVENAKTNAEDTAEAEKIMKTGKMAPNPNKPKMKFRCGAEKKCGHKKSYKHGGLVKSGKPKLARKGWK